MAKLKSKYGKIYEVSYGVDGFTWIEHDVIDEIRYDSGKIYLTKTKKVYDNQLLKSMGFEGRRCYCLPGDILKAMNVIAESQKEKINRLYDNAQKESELYNSMLLLVIEAENAERKLKR